MAPRKRVSLPPWARVVHPTFDTDIRDPLPLAEEESYLRTRAYVETSRQIDQAIHNALKRLCAPVYAELQQLLDRVRPKADYATTTIATSTATSDTGSDASKEKDQVHLDPSHFVMEPCGRYPTELLPVLVVQGPSYALDRHEWLRHLVRETKRRFPRTVVVQLTEECQQSWQHEVARQCLQQEPDKEILGVVQKTYGHKHWSLTERLVHWASQTTAFDDIVVIYDSSCSSSRTREDVIQWMADRRARYGLPLALVLTTSPISRWRLELSSCSNRLLVRNCMLPPTDTWLEECLAEPSLLESVLLRLSPSILTELIRSYRDQHGSVIRFGLHLKQALAQSFAIRGSFGDCPAIWTEEEHRIASLLLHVTGRAFLSKSQPSPRTDLRTQWHDMYVRRQRASVALQVWNQLHRNSNNNLGIFDCLNRKTPSFGVRLELNDKRDLLQLLQRLRTNVRGSKDDDDGVGGFAEERPEDDRQQQQQQSVLHLIHELIILVDQCHEVSDVEQCLAPVIQEWKEQQQQQSIDDAILESSFVQPRRHTVEGLVEEVVPVKHDDGDGVLCITNLVGTLFELVHDRVSIAQDEWFAAFRQGFALTVDREEATFLFASGVNFLKLCGLIREKRATRGGGVVYEKAALVWSGGD